jgi:predicted nuclease with TOPRIM domain
MHEDRRKSWHMDQEQVRKVIVSIIVTVFLQTISLIGTGLWAFSKMQAVQNEHERRLAEHERMFSMNSATGERIAKLEVIAERLERAVDRLNDYNRKPRL